MPSLADYRAHLEANFSPHTARSYWSTTLDFLAFCKRTQTGIANATVQAYLTSLVDRCEPVTIRQRKFALSTFFHFRGEQLTLAELKTPRVVSRESKFVDLATMGKYTSTVTARVQSDGLRALLLLLPLTGLRVGEICSLTPANLVRAAGGYAFRFIGKGSKERTIPLNAVALRVLSDHLRRRGTGPGLLFGVAPHAVRERLRALRGEMGLPWLTPHKLRHTFCYSLVKRGVHPKTIMRLMGHSSLRQTERYMHTDDEMLREAVDSLAGAVEIRPRLALVGRRLPRGGSK